MQQVLGLDGGGTKTVAILVNETGHVVRHCRTDGLDPTAGPRWEDVLAGIAADFGPQKAAVLGLPFHGEIAAVSTRQSAVATAVFGADCRVVNDVAVAFEGAFAGGDGVLVLAGTGSMAWARGPLGMHRVGGWGDAFGDEGSAHWIGRKALALVSQALDGRAPASPFADALLASMGIAGPDLIGWSYSHASPRAGIASVAAHVSALAQAGHREARVLMGCAATHLALLGQTAARLSGSGNWSFAGGVLKDPLVLSGLTEAMSRPPQPPRLPPVGGAALAAAKAAGWPTPPAFIARLNADLTLL